MKTLGHFKYHIYEVKLESNDDETQYTLTCIERTLRTMDKPIDENTDMQVRTFVDLSSSKGAFEKAVDWCINRTSFSDLSIFKQQTNGV